VVAAVQFYASDDDVTALLDHIGEGRTATIWQWPLVEREPVSLSRTEAGGHRSVVVLSEEFGPPVVMYRDDPALREGTVTAVMSTINFQRLDPGPGVGLVHPDRSPVLFWQPGRVGDGELTTHLIGSQAQAMRAISPEYERWVKRVMGWVRRRGTKVWGLEQGAVRPDLDVRVRTVSAVYALPGALRLLECGATGVD